MSILLKSLDPFFKFFFLSCHSNLLALLCLLHPLTVLVEIFKILTKVIRV